MLSAEFIEFAGLEQTALFAGIGRSFQIWHPEVFREREATARANAKANGVPKLQLRHNPSSPDGGS